jgi:hypothetical protein
MTMYMTKVWGFGEPCGPLQFSLAGWRKRARETLRDGDLVVLVGTKGDETLAEEKGRLLGIMEPTTEPAMSLDFDVRKADWDFDEEGNYKWPYALLNKRAWILEERPLLSEIANRRFNMDAAQGIVGLTDEEIGRIEGLQTREIDLLPTIRGTARLEGHAVARKRAAPPPSTTRTGVMHMRRAPAFTYCMALEGADADAHKVGWAFDYHLRSRQFNQASMPQIGGILYQPRLNHLWATARQAFKMEQALFDKFSNRLHTSNREVIVGVPYREIEAAWVKVVSRMSR